MDALIRLLFSAVTLVIALIPLWFFLSIKALFSPEGFWQKFAVYGAGIYLFGVVQIILLITWTAILVMIWSKD